MGSNPVNYPIAPGEVLANKYRIERLLGVGGMGMVVAARHIELDEQVAIKLLLPEALNNTECVRRFAREARSAVKIKSEHVVRTMDVDKLDNGAPYMVMEYLEGMDLEKQLRVQGPLTINHAVAIGLQVCEALAAAHAIGIVHRDLKPANLFATLGPDGRECIKVLDFGISKMRNPGIDPKSLTVTGDTTLIGSPLYMSPEQISSPRDVDHRCDIWALGVTLHELMTGKAPFFAATISTLIERVTSHEPPSLRDTRPDVPDKLAAVILKCMEKNRDDRYSNVAELALALVEFAPPGFRHCVDRTARVVAAAGFSTTHAPIPAASDASTSTHASTQLPVTSTRNPAAERFPRRLSLWFGGGLVLLGVAAVVWRFAGRTDHQSIASAPLPEPSFPSFRPATALPAGVLTSSVSVSPVPVPEASVAPLTSAAGGSPNSKPHRGPASVVQTQGMKKARAPNQTAAPATNKIPYDGNISRK